MAREFKVFCRARKIETVGRPLRAVVLDRGLRRRRGDRWARLDQLRSGSWAARMDTDGRSNSTP